jgi:hypothetical protein
MGLNTASLRDGIITLVPGEDKIVLLAECLGQEKDELLTLAGKVSTDVTEIILRRPKETTALLRRLGHASPVRITRHAESLPSGALEFYPLDKVSHENHTAVVGESGSGKFMLTNYLIHSYFGEADVRVYDSDAAPGDWEDLPVVGRKGDYGAIAFGMLEDLNLLQHRTELHGDGLDLGSEIVRVIEEYPSAAAELTEIGGADDMIKDIGLLWLRRLLRRGRKYRIGPSPQRPASRGSNLPPARSRLDGAGLVCSSAS